MTSSRKFAGILGVVALAAIASPRARADEGRIPVYQSTAIHQPGSYVLTRDIPSGTGPAITIFASDVTLDLGGRRIVREAPAWAIQIGNGAKNVRIKNGYLVGGNGGVYGGESTMTVLEDLWISQAQSGIALYDAKEATIARCHVLAPSMTGIEVSGPAGAPASARVVDNEVSGAGADAIVVSEMTGAEVRGNHIRGFGLASGSGGSSGISVSGVLGRHSVVASNVVIGSDDDVAIRIGASDCRIEGNTASSAKYGIYVSGARATVRGNAASANLLHGIWVAGAHNSVAENTATANGGSGIMVSGTHTLVLGNHSEANATYGIVGGPTTNRYRDNMLLGNGSGAVSGGQDAGGNITS